MAAIRRAARALLEGVARHSPDACREWAEAMAAELDFVDGDWEALWWALGSTTAMVRCSFREWWRWLRSRQEKKEARVDQIGKKTVGVISGAVLAAALLACALGLLFLGIYLFPSLGLDHKEWAHVLTLVLIPETIFVIAIVKLWRKRGPMALGILLMAGIMVIHVLVHFVRR
jgi:hypothetical protein